MNCSNFMGSFEDHRWNDLIKSMPERMKAVIKNKGGPTHY